MATHIGIRDLRNRTSEAVRLAQVEGEVVITQHGRPVAVLRPYVEDWKVEAQQLLDALPEPFDTGLADLLAHSDDASGDD